MKALVERLWPLGQELSIWLVAVVELLNRVLVAKVFWDSGLTKIATWDTTLYLFQEEYKVPLLPPELAAYLGTAAELTLPIFVVLGLMGRFTGSALFLVNLVAAYSYFDSLINRPIGIMDHQIWAVMLLIVAIRGGGKLSLDSLIGWVGTRRGWLPRAA